MENISILSRIDTNATTTTVDSLDKTGSDRFNLSAPEDNISSTMIENMPLPPVVTVEPEQHSELEEASTVISEPENVTQVRRLFRN